MARSTGSIAGSTLPSLIAANVLDPAAAGLIWLVVGLGIPVVVTGTAPHADRRRLLAALAQARPDAAPWPDELGALEAGSTVADPGMEVRRYLLDARDGRMVGATAEAPDLAALLDRLGGPPFRLSRDELGHLGLVLVMTAGDGTSLAAGHPRLSIAHWLRPIARDAHGHVQRFPPVVLGMADGPSGAWDDFSWGVMADLAERSGRRPDDLERDLDARSAFLRRLGAAGIVGETEVGVALAGYGLGAGRAVGEG